MAHHWREGFAGGLPFDDRDLESWLADAPGGEAEAHRARTRLIAVGWLALLAGVIAIAVPIAASVAIAIFIGWVLLATGVVTIVHTFSHPSLLRGFDGIVSFLAGLYLVAFPLSGTVTLTFVLAVWFFASGLMSLVAAARTRIAGERALMIFGGLLSIVLGALIAVELPSSAAWAIGLLVGINLIFWGIRALFAAQQLRPHDEPAQRLDTPTARR
jgi:uncharacterized membrane protein HdeD (DUF308 family)